MGQAKIKARANFPAQLVAEWEQADCVNFAVALSRLTGWLLHVDWWSTSTVHRENVDVDELLPLRVYVADNHDRIFDVRGIKTIVEFNEGVLVRIARGIGSGNGCVYTRFYSEPRLLSLPLRHQPDENNIAIATEAIKANHHFLGAIPVRHNSFIPAHKAAEFSYGRCAAFAEAMQKLTGLQPAGLVAIRYSASYERSKRADSGYFHSVVIHPNGMAEDAWGVASIQEIAERFGVVEVQVSTKEHREAIENIIRSSADLYAEALEDAVNLITVHRSSVHRVGRTLASS